MYCTRLAALTAKQLFNFPISPFRVFALGGSIPVGRVPVTPDELTTTGAGAGCPSDKTTNRLLIDRPALVGSTVTRSITESMPWLLAVKVPDTGLKLEVETLAAAMTGASAAVRVLVAATSCALVMVLTSRAAEL